MYPLFNTINILILRIYFSFLITKIFLRQFFIWVKKKPKLGINSMIAGTNTRELVKSITTLNKNQISTTIDNLGEYVTNKKEVYIAKTNILEILEIINQQKLQTHLSIKLTQLGLDIDYDLCKESVTEIVEKASAYNVFVNFDMEDYGRLEPTWKIIKELKNEKFTNIGTVIQSCLYQSEQDVTNNSDMRLRIVKGAYKEGPQISYQNQKDIDQNFIKIAKHHLQHGKFTSIATHDHVIIDEIKKFIAQNNISKDKFEFQMLYGFRKDLQDKLVIDGYNLCIYMPYGTEWYGYFMRRLAERPKNINLLFKQIINGFNFPKIISK